MSSTPTAVKENSGLTLSDVGKKSEMEGLGWSVNQNDDKTWSAHEKAGELRSFGPAKNLSALHTMLMTATGNNQPKGKTVKAGSSKLEGGEFKENSQPILTGTENAVFEDMKSAGIAYRTTTMQILELQAIQKQQKSTLEELMLKFKDELSFDSAANERFFTVDVEGEPIDIVLETKEVDSIKTRKHSS